MRNEELEGDVLTKMLGLGRWVCGLYVRAGREKKICGSRISHT